MDSSQNSNNCFQCTKSKGILLPNDGKKVPLCRDCALSSTLTGESVNAWFQPFFCEECEQNEATVNCIDCDQKLCSSCENILHKRGTRANHKRQKTSKDKEQPICFSSFIFFYSLPSKKPLNIQKEMQQAFDFVLGRFPQFPVNVMIHESLTSLLPKTDSETAEEARQRCLFRDDFDFEWFLKTAHATCVLILDLDHENSQHMFKLSETASKKNSTVQVFVNFIQNETPKKLNLLEELSKDMINSKEGEQSKEQKNSGSQEDRRESWPHTPSFGHSGMSPVSPDEKDITSCTGLYAWQPTKETEYDALLTKDISDSIQINMRALAENGDLLIPSRHFDECVAKWCGIDLQQAVSISIRAEKKKIINRTTRVFSRECAVSYISMNLDFLTIQSLIWTIKSLYKDGMTPSEKLVISRIKEAFTLKIQQKQWDLIIKCLKPMPTTAFTFPGAENERSLSSLLFVEAVYDPNVTTNINVIKLKEVQKEEFVGFDDQGEVDKTEKNLLWKHFIDFLESFFTGLIAYDSSCNLNEVSPSAFCLNNSSDNSKLQPEEQGMTPEELSNNRATNNLSTIIEADTETSLLRREKSNNDTSSWSKTFTTNSESHILGDYSLISNETSVLAEQKSIPGGRYGCAYFVKSFGPADLRALSIGKLSLFVQEALNIGYLRYQRTLILKNEFRKIAPSNSIGSAIYPPLLIETKDKKNEGKGESGGLNNEEKKGDASPLEKLAAETSSQQNKQKVQLLTNVIIEILSENPKGMPLAQIPHYIKRKLQYSVNFQELGYPKLKNFLKSMSDQVQIKVSSSNNSYAVLTKEHFYGSGSAKTQLAGQVAISSSEKSYPSMKSLIMSSYSHGQPNNPPGLSGKEAGLIPLSNKEVEKSKGTDGLSASIEHQNPGGSSRIIQGSNNSEKVSLNNGETNIKASPGPTLKLKILPSGAQAAQQNSLPPSGSGTSSQSQSNPSSSNPPPGMTGAGVKRHVKGLSSPYGLGTTKNKGESGSYGGCPRGGSSGGLLGNPPHTKPQPTHLHSKSSSYNIAPAAEKNPNLNHTPVTINPVYRNDDREQQYGFFYDKKEKRPQRQRRVSNLDDYLRLTLEIIGNVLSRHQLGVEINILYKEICMDLGFPFDQRLFGCDDFYTFLLQYMSGSLDMEIKNAGKGRISMYVYPKETKFRPGNGFRGGTGMYENYFQNNSMYDVGFPSFPGFQGGANDSQHFTPRSVLFLDNTDNSVVRNVSMTGTEPGMEAGAMIFPTNTAAHQPNPKPNADGYPPISPHNYSNSLGGGRKLTSLGSNAKFVIKPGDPTSGNTIKKSNELSESGRGSRQEFPAQTKGTMMSRMILKNRQNHTFDPPGLSRLKSGINNEEETRERKKSHKRVMSMWATYNEMDNYEESPAKPFLGYQYHEKDKREKDNHQEESNVTLSEQIRFIDSLLEDGPPESQGNCSFKMGGFSEISSIPGNSPNSSVSHTKPGSQVSHFSFKHPHPEPKTGTAPPFHSKTLSQDYQNFH